MTKGSPEDRTQERRPFSPYCPHHLAHWIGRENASSRLPAIYEPAKWTWESAIQVAHFSPTSIAPVSLKPRDRLPASDIDHLSSRHVVDQNIRGFLQKAGGPGCA